MQKLVNGELVDLTPEEIAARQAEEAATQAAQIAAHLPAYREQVIKNGFTLHGIPFKGDDTTMLRLAGARIRAESDPDFVTKWGGIVPLTAAQIIAASDAMANLTNKAFEAFGELSGQKFTSIEELETAFNEAMEA